MSSAAKIAALREESHARDAPARAMERKLAQQQSRRTAGKLAKLTKRGASGHLEGSIAPTMAQQQQLHERKQQQQQLQGRGGGGRRGEPSGAEVAEARSRLARLKQGVVTSKVHRKLKKQGGGGGGSGHVEGGWQDTQLAGKIGECKAAVCRITTRGGAYGTGFLIDFENHACVATTHGLLPTPLDAAAAVVEFDYEESATLPGVPKTPFGVDLDPESLFLTCGKVRPLARSLAHSLARD